jgi:hypothetical protein
MRRPVISIAMVVAVVAGCAATAVAPSSSLTSPSAVASPEVVCDMAQFRPTPSLTCGPAIAAALPVLGPAHARIIREEFRWGGLCPPARTSIEDDTRTLNRVVVRVGWTPPSPKPGPDARMTRWPFLISATCADTQRYGT